MFKKCILIIGLSLTLCSLAYAKMISTDVISASEKDFNNQVMDMMKDIENKSIDEKNIDKYLDHAIQSIKVKQAVKSNILNHVKYSDYRKVADGIYYCNANKVSQTKKDSICNYMTNQGYHCIYSYGNTCQESNCHN